MEKRTRQKLKLPPIASVRVLILAMLIAMIVCSDNGSGNGNGNGNCNFSILPVAEAKPRPSRPGPPPSSPPPPTGTPPPPPTPFYYFPYPYPNPYPPPPRLTLPPTPSPTTKRPTGTPTSSPPLVMRDWTPFYVTFVSDADADGTSASSEPPVEIATLKKATEEYFDAFMNDRRIAEGEFFRSVDVTVSTIDVDDGDSRNRNRKTRRHLRQLRQFSATKTATTTTTTTTTTTSSSSRSNIRGSGSRRRIEGKSIDGDVDNDNDETTTMMMIVEISGVVAFDPVGVPPPSRMEELRNEAFLLEEGNSYTNALKKEGVYGNGNGNDNAIRAIASSTNPMQDDTNHPGGTGAGTGTGTDGSGDNHNETGGGGGGSNQNHAVETEIVNATTNGNRGKMIMVNTVVPIVVVLIVASIAALLFVQYKRRKTARGRGGNGSGNGGSGKTLSNSISSKANYTMPHVIVEEASDNGDGGGGGGDGEPSSFELMSPSMTTTYSIQDSEYTNNHHHQNNHQKQQRGVNSTISKSTKRSQGTMMDYDLDAYSLDGASGLGKTPNQGDRMLGQVLAMGEYIPTPTTGTGTGANHADASADYSAISQKPALIRVISTLSSNHNGEDDDDDDDPSVFTYSNDYGYDHDTTSVLGGGSAMSLMSGTSMSMMSETYSAYGRKMTIGDKHSMMQKQSRRKRVDSMDGSSTYGIEIMVEHDEEDDDNDHHDTPDLNRGENGGLVVEEISPLTLVTIASPAVVATGGGHQLSFSAADNEHDVTTHAHEETSMPMPIPPTPTLASHVTPTFIKVSKIVETEKTSNSAQPQKQQQQPSVAVPIQMKKVITAREEPLERTYSQFQRGPASASASTTQKPFRSTSQSHKVRGNKITVTSANSPSSSITQHQKPQTYPTQSATSKTNGVPSSKAKKAFAKLRIMQINDRTSRRALVDDDSSSSDDDDDDDDSYSSYGNTNGGDGNSDGEDSALEVLRKVNNGSATNKTPSPRYSATNNSKGGIVAAKGETSKSPKSTNASTRTANSTQKSASGSMFPLQRVTSLKSPTLDQKFAPYRSGGTPVPVIKDEGISTTNYAAVARRNRLNRMANTRNHAGLGGRSDEDGGTGRESLSNQVASLRRARLQQRRG